MTRQTLTSSNGLSVDRYARRNNAYYNTTDRHPESSVRSKQNAGVTITQEFSTDIESTTDLLFPMPALQSYPMTVTTIQGK